MRLFFLLLFLCGLSSCVRERTETFPWGNQEPVPVVFSIITPDRPVQVALTQTLLNGAPPEYPVYPQAEVFLSNGDSEVKLARLYPDTALFADTARLMPITQGASYRLRVETGEHSLLAETTLPDRAGSISRAVFTQHRTDSSNFDYNGSVSIIGALQVDMDLPDFNTRKYILLHRGNSPGDEVFVTGTHFTDPTWFFSEADSLQIISPDPWLTKYYMADYISGMKIISGYSGMQLVDAVMSFAGVLPAYSNIRNGGIGLFGSYLISESEITKKNLTSTPSPQGGGNKKISRLSIQQRRK